MKVVEVRNVCQALPCGMELLKRHGKIEESRAGKVLVCPTPVTTVYTHPTERVLFSRVRNANPFFHLFESLHMLAGRNDAAFLDQFIGDFGKRFAEPDGRIHDAYGFRWRKQWPGMDQLEMLIAILKKDPSSRQAVLEMWDPKIDLGVPGLKTRPCNTHAYFRLLEQVDGLRLDMTVCCRSNDIIWGAYGANAVHFSILQEYIAAALGVNVGSYYQISNNYHAYLDVFDKFEGEDLWEDRYYSNEAQPSPLVDDPETFIQEVEAMLNGKWMSVVFKNRFLSDTAWPMWQNYKARKYVHPVAASDWRAACVDWLGERARKRGIA